MPELIAPLPHLGVRGEEAVHRALGAEILPFVEQRGVDLARARGPRSAARASASSTAACSASVSARGERRPRRRGALGPPPPVVRGPGHARAPHTWARCPCRGPISVTSGHHEGSVVSGVPSNAATFFWSSTSASARSARCFQRVISRAWSAITLSRGSRDPRRRGPRFFARPGQLPPLPRRAPRRQMRGVQPLPPQQRPDGARRLSRRPPPARSSACTPPVNRRRRRLRHHLDLRLHPAPAPIALITSVSPIWRRGKRNL